MQIILIFVIYSMCYACKANEKYCRLYFPNPPCMKDDQCVQQQERRKVWFVARLQLIATVFLFALNTVYFNQQILILISIFTLITGLLFWLYFRTKNFKRWANSSIVLLGIDFAYYAWTGGNNGAGILWSLVFPFIVMYLKGYKVGFRICVGYYLLLVLMVAVMAFIHQNIYYSTSYILVFLTVNAVVLLILYQIEKSRYDIQEEFDRSNNLFNHATDLLFIGNNKGHFITVNPACSQALGWSNADLLNKPLTDFIHPLDVNGLILNGEDQQTTAFNQVLECRFLCKDGTYKWLSWRSVVDPNQALVYTVARDITEPKQHEENLRFRVNIQQLITEVTADFINSTPDNFNHKVNDLLARIGDFLKFDRGYLFECGEESNLFDAGFAWNRQGVEPVSMHSITPLCLSNGPVSQLYFTDLSTTEVDFEWVKKRRKEGCTVTLLVQPLVVRNRTYALLGFETVHQANNLEPEILELVNVLAHILTEVLMKHQVDVDLRTVASELNSLNKTKDKLFSIIAHDLRSPFNAFIGFTEMMSDPTSSMTLAAIKNYAGMLNRVAQSSFDLLENLLEWCRLQQGLLHPEPSKLSVSTLIHDAINPFLDKAVSKSLLINQDVEPELTACLDKRMVETILRNLFSNALKYTHQGGVITLAAQRPSDGVILFSVSDTGIGIPEKLIPELFTVNESKSRPGLGGERSTGLGLMLCKEFVDIHKGRIWVDTTEYKGSTFYVELPSLCDELAMDGMTQTEK